MLRRGAGASVVGGGDVAAGPAELMLGDEVALTLGVEVALTPGVEVALTPSVGVGMLVGVGVTGGGSGLGAGATGSTSTPTGSLMRAALRAPHSKSRRASTAVGSRFRIMEMRM